MRRVTLALIVALGCGSTHANGDTQPAAAPARDAAPGTLADAPVDRRHYVSEHDRLLATAAMINRKRTQTGVKASIGGSYEHPMINVLLRRERHEHLCEVAMRIAEEDGVGPEQITCVVLDEPEPVVPVDRARHHAEYDFLLAVARSIHWLIEDPAIAVTVGGSQTEPMITVSVRGAGLGPHKEERCSHAMCIARDNGVGEDQIACVLSDWPRERRAL